MKEVTREIKREVKETLTGWESLDGTFFHNREECRNYEESALGVLRGRLQQFIVSDRKDAWELMGGWDEHKIVAVLVDSDEARDTLLQLIFAECPYLLNNSNALHKERKAEIEKIVNDAYADNEIILLGINIDGEYYFINSRQNIINNLMTIDQKEVLGLEEAQK